MNDTYPHYTYGFLRVHEETGRVIFLVASEKNELLGFAEMRPPSPEMDVYEVMATVARPGFGRLLYQGMAKFAHFDNKFIASSRDGDVRGPALEKWDEFFEDTPPEHRQRLSEELNEGFLEYLTEEEAEPYSYAYQIPADSRFVEALCDIKQEKVEPHWGKLVMQGNTWWDGSYENDDNRWINDSYPLDNDTLTARDYPYTALLSKNEVHVVPEWYNAENPAAEAACVDLLKCIVTLKGDCVVLPTRENADSLSTQLMKDERVRVSIQHDERLHGVHPEFKTNQECVRLPSIKPGSLAAKASPDDKVAVERSLRSRPC